MFKRLFKEHGIKNVITIFHKPSSPPSTRVLNLLKQHNATSSATATEDQASSHVSQSQTERTADFELDVSEAQPTADQLRNILEYIGDENVGKLVPGVQDRKMALEKMERDAESFRRPVVVDWNGGRAVIGDDQSEILNLLKTLKKD